MSHFDLLCLEKKREWFYRQFLKTRTLSLAGGGRAQTFGLWLLPGGGIIVPVPQRMTNHHLSNDDNLDIFSPLAGWLCV